MTIIAHDSNERAKVPLCDSTGRIYVIPGSQAHDMWFEAEDDNIPGGRTPQLVVCLNYVWDAGNSKWVRMTQP